MTAAFYRERSVVFAAAASAADEVEAAEAARAAAQTALNAAEKQSDKAKKAMAVARRKAFGEESCSDGAGKMTADSAGEAKNEEKTTKRGWSAKDGHREKGEELAMATKMKKKRGACASPAAAATRDRESDASLSLPVSSGQISKEQKAPGRKQNEEDRRKPTIALMGRFLRVCEVRKTGD